MWFGGQFRGEVKSLTGTLVWETKEGAESGTSLELFCVF
jgi:hypothetical protein